MQISLKNQVVLVTGGAKRLGREIALQCARSGAQVAITFNASEKAARETVAQMQEIAAAGESENGVESENAGAFANADKSGTASTRARKFAAFPLEVSDARAVAQLHETLLREFGEVTALVNNAAIFRRTPFLGCDENDFDAHIDANLKGPFLLSRVFGAYFFEQGAGAIVNIADIHGRKPLKNYVPYCVSKAGLIMLSQATAKALAPRVRVNCLCPGTILPPSEGADFTENAEPDDFAANSQMLRNRVPLGRLGTPQEIAQCVAFLIGGPQFISGAILNVDGAESLR